MTLPPVLRAHPAAAPGGGAAPVLDDPLGIVEVEVTTPGTAARVDGVFGPAGYALATQDAAEALLTGPVSVLPQQLALLVALGARPFPDEPAIVHGDPAAFAADDPDLPPAVAAVLRAPDVARWTVRASWVAPDGPAYRTVAAIDGAAAGLLLCGPREDAEDEVVVFSARAVDAWRALCTLLPYPDEIELG